MHQTFYPPFCPPIGPTAYLGCGQAQSQNVVGPTGWYTCTQPIGHTGWLGCGQTTPPNCVGPTGYQGCGQQANAQPFPTIPVNQCLVTYQCNQANAQNVGVTGWQGCGQTTPPNCVGPTGWQGCGQQANAQPFPTIPVNQCLVTYQCNQANAQNVGVTGWQGCGQTTPPNCVGPTGWQGCGQQANAQPFPTIPVNQCLVTYHCSQANAQTVGPTGWQGCFPTTPPNCVGPTGWHTCQPVVGPTAYQGCVPNSEQNQAQAQIPTIPVNQCAATYIPTACCTGMWPVC